MKRLITLNVNGESHEVAINPERTLLEVLRMDLGLTGVKEGCSGLGECGACTVLMNGKPVLACLVLASDARDKNILTIEGLAVNGQMHSIQKSFVEHGAVQCGFCTPGMIMSAKALLDSTPHPDEGDVKRAIAGNLCRCSGYRKIIEATTAASQITSN